jgi:hypothetical protein
MNGTLVPSCEGICGNDLRVYGNSSCTRVVDPLTGRERRRSKTVRGSKREAQRALTRLLHEADEGKLAASTTVTVSELIESWLDLVETDLAATTVDGYRNLVRWYIEPGYGQPVWTGDRHVYEYGLKVGFRADTRAFGYVDLYLMGSVDVNK